ncbi:MAG TPA: hypothetical protein ENK18_05880 [Deltaproteobacteria bacterium]|nr:hypothetical protein [Deltaproteobacteria bacterium]
MGVWLLTAGVVWASDCPERTEILAELELAVQEGRFEEADVERTRLVEAFGCGAAAGSETLARMWLAEAVILSSFGDEDGADDALKAAGRIAPDLWLDAYGPAFQARWFEAQASEVLPGRLRLQPMPEGHVALIDGEVTELPGFVPSGLHVTQVGPSPNNIAFAKEVFLLPDQDLVVRTLFSGRTTGGGSEGLPTLLVVGGVTALGAITTAGLAVGWNERMRNAQTQPELDAAFRTQRVFGATSYTLMATTALSVGLHVAL